MQKLKDYFAANRRMNRKPFILIMLGYFLMGLVLAGVFLSNGKMSGMVHSIVDISQQQARHEITAEEAREKIHAIEAAELATIPFWHYIPSSLLAIALLPAVAMRLKDVNWSPKLAALVLLTAILGPYAKIGNVAMVGYFIMALSVAEFILFLLLIFMKGTTGTNPYGPDPLEPKIAAA